MQDLKIDTLYVKVEEAESGLSNSACLFEETVLVKRNLNSQKDKLLCASFDKARTLEAENDELKKRQEVLMYILGAGKRISTASNWLALLNLICREAANIVGANDVAIWLKDEQGRLILTAAATYQLGEFLDCSAPANDLDSPLGRSYSQCSTEFMSDPKAIQDFLPILPMTTSAILVIPIGDHDPLGVMLFVDNRASRSFTEDDVEKAEILVGHASLAIQNAQLLRLSRSMYLATVRLLANVQDRKDPFLHHHCVDVSRMAGRIAKKLGLTSKEIEVVELAGLIHDVGKVGIDDDLIEKSGPLSEQEREILRQHPVIGAEIVVGVGHLMELVPLIEYHHERFDGTGYPEGLQGEAIPLGARILAAANAYERLVNERKYRSTDWVEDVKKQLEERKGTQLDPLVVDMLLPLI